VTAAYLSFADFQEDLDRPEGTSLPERERRDRSEQDPPSDEQGNDAHWIARIRGGDETAYRELVLTHFVPLVRYALTILPVRADAEDVVQETLARIWTGREAWSPTGPLRASLFAAVRNRALNVLRHEGVARRYAAVMALASETPSASSASQDDRVEQLERLLPQLTERQQTALALRYEHGMRHSEIAHTLGISLRAAEQLVMRALATLRSGMQER